MDTKVSMVIPCYNKVNYIDDMFKSVYDQAWNNIELILVNDGSTDGTRGKIAEWESTFKKRGYQVVIIDQENKGVGAAVKNGLLKITGDYVCIPDCDDILKPNYVSHMAGILDRNLSVQWVFCNATIESDQLSKMKNKNILLLMLMHKFHWSVYTKFIRTSYLIECRVLENYLESRVTQEPQIYIPLAAGGAWPYIVCKNLYSYNTSVELSIRDNVKKRTAHVVRYWNDYMKIQHEILKKCGLMTTVNRLACEISITSVINDDLASFALSKLQTLLKYTNNIPTDIESNTMSLFCEHAFELIFDIPADEPLYITKSLKTAKRVICCCCLGSVGKKFLPLLIAAGLNPNLLWDANSDFTQGGDCNTVVSTPQYSKLTEGDVVFILSTINSNISEIKKSIGNNTTVFTLEDVEKYIKWRCSEIYHEMQRRQDD
jgi:glycosyltransferase involved in cell wall biosynthesis